MISALLAMSLAAADPCAPVALAGSLDADAATAYREVGDAERAAGSRETAVVAYRQALAHNPSDAAARRALDSLCQEALAPPDAEQPSMFSQGLARMDAGDLRGASVAFQAARRQAPDPAAALLQGVCLYALGEDDRAEPLFREAEAAAAHQDAARFYRGLIALRSGRAAEAASLLDAAAASQGFGPLAADVARIAHRTGRLVLSVFAESRWDSNVPLLANSSPEASQAGDGAGGLTASALLRPFGRGPYLRVTGLVHKQLQLNAYDLAGVSPAFGWQLSGTRHGLLAEYGFDYRALGWSSFLLAHRLFASGWTNLGRLSLSGSYFARFESFQSTWEPFSGTLQGGEARGALSLGPARIGIAYHLSRDSAKTSELSWWEHGPRAELKLRLGSRARAGLEVGVSWRSYSGVSPTLSVKRADTYFDGAALAEYDISDHWIARFSLEARRALSNASAFQYSKLVPTLGLGYVVGL